MQGTIYLMYLLMALVTLAADTSHGSPAGGDRRSLKNAVERFERVVEKLQDTVNRQQTTIEAKQEMIDEFREEFKQKTSSNGVGFAAFLYAERSFDEGNTLIFDTVLTNHGSSFDVTSSVFRCPADGIYAFAVSIMSKNNSVSARLMIDYVEMGYTETHHDWTQASTFTVAHCSAGGSAYVQMMTDSNMVEGKVNSFSGHLLELTMY